MSNFAIGDVVRLKSGGPFMTVGGIGQYGYEPNIQVHCRWFKNLSELGDEYFPPEALQLKTADEL